MSISDQDQRNASSPPRHIVFVLVPPVAEVDLTGPLTIFHGANLLAQAKQKSSPYKVSVVSAERGKTVEGECGLKFAVERRLNDLKGAVDTLIVVGGGGSYSAEPHHPAVRWLRENAPRITRVCSVCTGAFVLGAAGLLDGRRATTHWAVCSDLAARYPTARVEMEPIFVRDGNVYTSAGVTAGIDLALELVEQNLGGATALALARHMVMFLRRPGGQAQFSASLAAQTPERQSLLELQTWIAENISRPLTVEDLATRVAMSPRNFARVFARETQTTPARYVLRQRIEAARRELEQSSRSQDEIALRCGFATANNFRRRFIAEVGVTPGRYRESFNRAQEDP